MTKTFTFQGDSIHTAVDVTLLLLTIVQREETYFDLTLRCWFLQVNKDSKAPTFNIPYI